ncbi:hypothetical protein CIK06_09660 [Plantactinospora sp. KBS50]|nr:hypothetical protein CIK06_09660 [Plantactinospora sp. KBS50]
MARTLARRPAAVPLGGGSARASAGHGTKACVDAAIDGDGGADGADRRGGTDGTDGADRAGGIGSAGRGDVDTGSGVTRLGDCAGASGFAGGVGVLRGVHAEPEPGRWAVAVEEAPVTSATRDSVMVAVTAAAEA